jgi:toxin-antitoxin system PIN domain toxin
LIAVDTNILVYAHRADSPFHAAAQACVVSLAEGAGSWAIPWPCLHEFLAIVTHPRIYAPPSPLERALDQVDAWLESPALRLLTEAEEHWPALRDLVARGHIAGPKVHDARIAALCREHGVRELWSADRDFSRFPEIRVVNPLVAVGQPVIPGAHRRE